jgi:hypothetical protein
VLNDLGANAPAINTLIRRLGPFSQAAIPAFDSLGEASKTGTPAVIDARPVIADLRALATAVRPVGVTLRQVLESFRDTGGIERLLDYLFYQVAAINGFDSFGHYLRAGLIINTCTTYSTAPQPGCSAKWEEQEDADSRAASLDPRNVRAAFAARAGEDRSAEAMRRAAGARSRPRAGARAPKRALRLPTAVLPGDDATGPAGRRSAGERSRRRTQEGLLDYLLGDGS